MKRNVMWLMIVAVLTVATPALAPLAPKDCVRLEWDYPADGEQQVTFNLYHSSDLAAPMSNWAVLTNVDGARRSVEVHVQPGAHFFTLTASNFWGESDFSNVASTPALPRSDYRLTITRGDCWK